MISPICVCSIVYSQPRASQVSAMQVVLVVLVAGVDVDGDEREVDRRALAQDVEDLEQRPAVLAAGQPDHDAIAVLDQAVIDDRLGDLLGDAGFESDAYKPCDLDASRLSRNRSRSYSYVPS